VAINGFVSQQRIIQTLKLAKEINCLIHRILIWKQDDFIYIIFFLDLWLLASYGEQDYLENHFIFFISRVFLFKN
jgi:hypothetical protein